MFNRRLMKKRRAVKVIRGFFLHVRHENSKDLIWMVQRYRKKVMLLQHAWQQIYFPKYKVLLLLTLIKLYRVRLTHASLVVL